MAHVEQIRPDGRPRAGTPGRETRPKSVTIDIHSHVAVPQAAAFVKPHLDWSTIPLAHFATPETKALSAKQEDDIRSRITGHDERLADLDAMGIDMQLVMPPPPQCYYTVPLDIAVKAARMVNDGLAEFVARKPDRFVGARQRADGGRATRPPPSSTRCMKELALQGRARFSPTSPARSSPIPPPRRSGRQAEELGALVVIHPIGFTEARASRASISTTSSAIRSRPRSRCTT